MRSILRTMGLLGLLAAGGLLMTPTPSRAQCGNGGGGYGRAWGGHTFNAGYGGGGPYGGSGYGMAMGGMTMRGMGMGGYAYPTAARYGGPRGGGPNNPPYYSGAVHSLHGRGFDSARHGR